MATLSQLVSVKVLEQPNGDVLMTTTAGLTLPTHGNLNPLSTSDVNVAPDDYYPNGGIPAIMLGGADVTRQLQGGQIGANITLRDTTLPTDQAELDELSENTGEPVRGQRPDAVHRSDRQCAGCHAAAGAEGLCRLRSTTIQVNPAVPGRSLDGA